MALAPAHAPPRAAVRARACWTAGYLALALAPLALVDAVLPEREDGSLGLLAGAAFGLAAMSAIALQGALAGGARSARSPFAASFVLRAHRRIGLLALGLVVAHIALLVVSDPGTLALLAFPSAPWRAQAGAVGLVGLLGLCATSLWRRPLRLPYGAWRAGHLALAGAVAGGTCAHVVGVAAHLRVPALAWAALASLALALAAALHLRVVRPRAVAARPYRVRALRPERGGATTLELEADGHAGHAFRPGQFAWLRLDGVPCSLGERPFSVASSASRTATPAFTLRARPATAARLRALAVGDRVLLDGPHGGLRAARPDAGWVLVAGGIGITPVMSLLRTLADAGDRRPLLLVYASSRWEDVTFREEIAALEAQLALTVVHALSERLGGRLDPRSLAALLPPDAPQRNALVCGPPGLVAVARRGLALAGVPARQVQVEGFGPA
jgi:predicted ferric reductase